MPASLFYLFEVLTRLTIFSRYFYSINLKNSAPVYSLGYLQFITSALYTTDISQVIRRKLRLTHISTQECAALDSFKETQINTHQYTRMCRTR